jgi:hypothetical protein
VSQEIPTPQQQAYTPGKRGRKPKLTVEAVAGAIGLYRGNISAVARQCGVERVSVIEFIEKHPAVQKLLSDVRAGMIDDAESSLYRSVVKGELGAIKYYLNCHAKDRGYGESLTVEGGMDHRHSGAVGHRHTHTVDVRDLLDKLSESALLELESLIGPRLLPSPEAVNADGDHTHDEEAAQAEVPPAGPDA